MRRGSVDEDMILDQFNSSPILQSRVDGTNDSPSNVIKQKVNTKYPGIVKVDG